MSADTWRQQGSSKDLWSECPRATRPQQRCSARIAAGHCRAHEFQYWETYLLLANIPADGREQAQTRLKKAQAATVGVNLKLVPARVVEVGATYTLRRAAPDPEGHVSPRW